MKVIILNTDTQRLYQLPNSRFGGNRIPRQVTHSFLRCIDEMEAWPYTFSRFNKIGFFACEPLAGTEGYDHWSVSLVRGYRLIVLVDYSVPGPEEVWVLRMEFNPEGAKPC